MYLIEWNAFWKLHILLWPRILVAWLCSLWAHAKHPLPAVCSAWTWEGLRKCLWCISVYLSLLSNTNDRHIFPYISSSLLLPSWSVTLFSCLVYCSKLVFSPPSMSSPVSGKHLTVGSLRSVAWGRGWSVVYANFCGVNTPVAADFMPQQDVTQCGVGRDAHSGSLKLCKPIPVYHCHTLTTMMTFRMDCFLDPISVLNSFSDLV